MYHWEANVILYPLILLLSVYIDYVKLSEYLFMVLDMVRNGPSSQRNVTYVRQTRIS